MPVALPLTSVYNLGPLTRIPRGEGRTFHLEGLAIAVFRARNGEVFATQALCPHRGGPLADGVIGDGKVICPLHAYKFALDSGQPVGHECDALKTYPVSINGDGDILLSLDTDYMDEEGNWIHEEQSRRIPRCALGGA